MEKLEIFRKRLEKLGIKVTFFGNYPWIYLDTINEVRVTEKFQGNAGFTVMFSPIRLNQKHEFTDITEIFKLIKKYTSCEICGGRNYHKISCPKIKTVIHLENGK